MSKNFIFKIATNKEKPPHIPSEPCWQESIKAIKDSLEFDSFLKFKQYLLDVLPQNSLETRKRYASYILKRFFHSGNLNELTVKVWKCYRDEELLQQIMRYQFLTVESLVGLFVESELIYFPPGYILKNTELETFVERVYNTKKRKVVSRLSSILRELNFIKMVNKKPMIALLPTPKTALLILTHHLFSPQPQTVTLKEILNHSFWKYLGIREESVVRKTFKEADTLGLISKYYVGDQLEQITTKYTLDEFLEIRAKL